MSFLEESKKRALENSEKFYRENLYIPSEADNFLKEIEFLFEIPQSFYFKKDGIKAIVNYKNNEFIIDYDYGYSDSILITFKEEHGFKVVETTLKKIKECIKDNTEV